MQVQQGRAAHHPVGVDQRVIDEAGGIGRIDQLGEVAAIAKGPRQGHFIRHLIADLEGGIGQRAHRYGGLLDGVEVVAQHGVAPCQGVGKHAVAVDQGLQLIQPLVEGVVFRVAGHLPQQTHIGTHVALGKHHVKAHGGHAMRGEPVQQPRKLVARPRPVAFGLQAGLINGHDHHAPIHAARRGITQTRVVQQLVDFVDVGQVQVAAGMPQQQANQQQRQHDADEITLHRVASAGVG